MNTLRRVSKRIPSLMAAALFAFCLTLTAYATPGDDEKAQAQITKLNASAQAALTSAQWDAFGENLVEALKTKHDGLQEAAMRLVIQHGNQVNVKDAVFDVMRIYRDHDNENLRRMAIVTLGQMENRWAIRFLQRSELFEDLPALRQTIRAVVADYKANHEG